MPAGPFDADAILDAVQASIVVVDADMRVVRWNAAAARLFGYSAEEAIGRPLLDLVGAPGSLPRAAEIIETLAGGGEWAGEFPVRRADGTVFPVEVRDTPLHDASGRFAGIVGLSVDITARKQAEEALRTTSDLLHSIVSSVPVVLFATDREGIITLSEGRGLRALGLAPGEVVGESVLQRYGDLIYSVCGESGTLPLDVIVARVLAGDSIQCGTTIGEIEYDVWFVPRRSEGVTSGVIGIAIDVTGRRQLEEQLHQAQKMEAVGLLAGGVAHDFNNMLTAILGYSELLAAELPAGPHRRDAEEIGRAAAKAATLTGQLLAFTRKQRRELEHIDVNAIVRDYEHLLRKTFGERVTVVVDLAAQAAGVLADRGQLEQVVMNLAVNAMDAMPDGGTFTIRTRVLEHAGMPAKANGLHVALEIADTGVGMEPATAARVFEPFFTTKPHGRGTGLGLATAYAIVRQHDGAISVESEPGRGTTFRIRLPYHAAPPERASPSGGGLPTAGRHATILVVEDEDSVRSLVESVLRRAGFDVLTAGGGEAALTVLRRGERVDLVLTDVVMPGMTGPQMVRELRAMRPDLRVLFMSGYSEPDVLAPGEPSLSKPFTAHELLRRVSELINS